MLAFDLDVDGLPDYSALSQRFLAALLERGCLVQAGNSGRTVRLLPSYLIETDEIDQLINAVREVASLSSFSRP